MALLSSDPFNTLLEREDMAEATVTGNYRMPDGVHCRLKAGDPLPEGYELVSPDPAFVKAEADAPENKAEAAPETKPTRQRRKSPKKDTETK